jgi:hypothetical protein
MFFTILDYVTAVFTHTIAEIGDAGTALTKPPHSAGTLASLRAEAGSHQ